MVGKAYFIVGGLRMKKIVLALSLVVTMAFPMVVAAAPKVGADDPINKTCPLSGKDVNPTKTVEYEKQLIGFCCDDCKGKFEADPKKYIGKVKEFKKKSSSVD
jgi:YHS domain-containing protein